MLILQVFPWRLCMKIRLVAARFRGDEVGVSACCKRNVLYAPGLVVQQLMILSGTYSPPPLPYIGCEYTTPDDSLTIQGVVA